MRTIISYAGPPITIRMTRDSVCMADDVEAPHDRSFEASADDTLADFAATVATSQYLPMPGDAWGWTIEVGNVVVAIRNGVVRNRVTTLRGDPSSVMVRDHPDLSALYVRPGSRWRNAVGTATTARRASRPFPRLLAAICLLGGVALLSGACQPGRSGPLKPAAGLPSGAPDAYDRPSSIVMAGPLSATISGSWTTRLEANSVDVRISYRNDGPRAVVMSTTGFAARRGGDHAELFDAVDMTGVDLLDDRTDNDEARQIVGDGSGPTSGSITIRPGEARIVDSSMAFAEGVEPLDAGQDVSIRVPVAGGARAVAFRTARSW